MAEQDELSAQGIRNHLSAACKDLVIAVIPSVDSTNTLVKEKAGRGSAEGLTVIAKKQTAGRGRRGRSFFSPEETGLYMSILLRPAKWPAERIVRITTMAAAAMCGAIEDVSDETAGIKWVNDILIRGKKVCGILTEASFDPGSGMAEYAVLGAGVNVYRPAGAFPEELEQIAGYLFEEPQRDGKNRLAAAFLNRFMEYYRAEDPAEYIETYRARSLAVGRQIRLLSAGRVQNAFAYGVDDACRLLVRYEDGTCGRLDAGEISIRL